MAASKHAPWLVILAFAITAIPVLYRWRRLQDLQQEAGPLRVAATEAERLREQNSLLERRQVELAELSRRGADQSELLRLRGEVNQLRQQVATNVSAPPTEPPRTSAVPAESRGPFTATLNLRVNNGYTLITGGWSVSPGNRAVAFLTPETSPNNPNGNVLVMTARFAIATDNAWALAGLDDFRAGARQSTLARVLAPDDDAVLQLQLDAAGIKVQSAGPVTTLSGRPTETRLASPLSAAPDTPGFLASASFAATFNDNRESFDVSVNVRLRPEEPVSAKDAFSRLFGNPPAPPPKTP